MPPTITTTGSTFSPAIALVGGSAATVTWSCSGFSDQTGLTPSFSFGSAATRTVTMTVTGGGGYADVTLFNLGYDNTIDAGLYMPSSGFVKAAESVSNVANVTTLTGLIYFLADHTLLASSIDFTGCAALQFIQCYSTHITGVTLTGCSSLKRLQIELSNVSSTLDLNPVSSTLYDLRAAQQGGGSLTFATLTSPMAVMYHFCVHDQTLINPPSLANLPAIEQFWTWNDVLSGALNPSSSALYDISSSGNQWSSADLTNQIPAARALGGLPPGSPDVRVDLHNNRLTSVILTGCNGLGDIDLSFNRLDQTAIDNILSTVASWGTSHGTIDLRNNTAPSAAGTASAATLTGRSWTVYVDSPVVANYPYRMMDGASGRPGVGSSVTQPPSTSNSGGPLCFSLSFEVTQPGLFVNGYYVWRADSSQQATADAALWKLTGHNTGALVASSHVAFSGMTVGQFNFGQLASPILLTANTAYAIVVGYPGNFPRTTAQFAGNKNPYGTGITNGPLFVYSSNFGVYPDPYNDDQYRSVTGSSNPTTTFPTGSFQQSNPWVDVQIVLGSGVLYTGFA